MEGEEGYKRVEGVSKFSYLGLTLDQTYDYWPAVLRNIMHVRLVWRIMGTLLQQEGAYPRMEEFFTGQWSKRYYCMVWRRGSFRRQWRRRYKGHAQASSDIS